MTTKLTEYSAPADSRFLASHEASTAANDATPNTATPTDWVEVTELTSVEVLVSADDATGTGNEVTVVPWGYRRQNQADPLAGAADFIWDKLGDNSINLGYDGDGTKKFVLDVSNHERLYLQVSDIAGTGVTWMWTEVFVHTARKDSNPVIVSGMSEALKSVFKFSATGLVVDTELSLDGATLNIDNLFVYAQTPGDFSTAGLAKINANSQVEIDTMQLGGNAISLGTGNVAGGTQRVTVADDDTNLSAIKTAIEIMDDWDESDRCMVNPIVGQAGVTGGSGAIDAATQRVTIATDDTVATDLTAIKDAVEIMDDWDSGDECKVSIETDNVGLATETTLVDIKTAVEIMDDWDESDRAAVNLISGQAGVTGNSGNVDASTQRVAVADDDTNLTAIKNAVEALDDNEPATSSTVINPTSSSDRTGSNLTSGSVYEFCATEDCWVCFCGSGGSATTESDMLLPAGMPRRWTVPAASDNYFAAIRDTVDGYVSITELS